MLIILILILFIIVHCNSNDDVYNNDNIHSRQSLAKLVNNNNITIKIIVTAIVNPGII